VCRWAAALHSCAQSRVQLQPSARLPLEKMVGQLPSCRYTHSAVRGGSSRIVTGHQSVPPPVCGVGTPTALLGEAVPGLLLDISQSPPVCGVGTPTVLLGREFWHFDPSHSEGTADVFWDGEWLGGGGTCRWVGVPHVSAAPPPLPPCPCR